MIKLIHFSFALSIFALAFSSCKPKEKTENLSLTFMYPKSSTPYVYVFQDSLNPFFEMFERIVTYYDPLGNHLLIERYNANFVLVEAYDLLYDKNYQVFNHLLYFGTSEIIAQVSDSTFVPWEGSGIFASSFQGTVDSIMFVMHNKRSLMSERGTFEWKGEKIATLQMVDSIQTMAIDLKNKREKPASVVAIHEFAEGMGRVRIRTLDGTSNLVLKAVLTEDEWKKLITK